MKWLLSVSLNLRFVVVALTLMPALGLLLLPKVAESEAREAPVTRFLKTRYRALLPLALNKPKRAAILLPIVFGITLIAVPFFGEEFLPNFQEYDFLMHWVGKPGTSLEAMKRVTVEVSKELRAIPGVRNFGSHIGRAEVADKVGGPEFAELWISLDPGVDYQSTVVRIYGPSLDVLRAKAAEVGKVVGEIPGIVDFKVEPQVLVPQVAIRIRPEVAQRLGITPGAIRARRRRGRGIPDRRSVVAGVVGWICNCAGNPRAQRDHDGQPLAIPGAGGRQTIRQRAGHPGCRGAPVADPDDRAGNRSGIASHRAGRQQART